MILHGFNPRTRTGCDNMAIEEYIQNNISFNPRTRTGCDADWDNITINMAIVSIHAPARGATTPTSATNKGLLSFNPRTRTGCDAYLFYGFVGEVWVSIHAPARGATVGGEYN